VVLSMPFSTNSSAAALSIFSSVFLPLRIVRNFKVEKFANMFNFFELNNFLVTKSLLCDKILGFLQFKKDYLLFL
jgi:hypothetical protein